MDENTYVALVIKHVYVKTIANKLKWKLERDQLSAEPIAPIRVRIHFKDHGPHAAVWERIFISNPVGEGLSMLVNPQKSRLSQFDVALSEETLQQINEIFHRFVLEPRQREFDAIITELSRS